MGMPLNRHIQGKDYNLHTFQVYNELGNALSCSFMEPASDADRTGDLMPCIIYMHGNGGNKMEGLTYGQRILPMGINLCSFDFSGCGNSEGDWVTLGYKEKRDLQAVINYLTNYKRVSAVGLWGRSMGATTSLFYM